jgi:1-acyl-sn-glycerol-3-phosphate acyltransferase
MLRTLWYYCVLVISTIVHSVGTIAAGVLRVRHRPGGIYDWGTSDWARQILRAAGTPVVVEGLERVPRGGPVIYASNHSSMFDIWALAGALPGSIRFVAKQELTRIPVFGRAMLTAGHVAIDRASRMRAIAAYSEAARVIRDLGVSTVVFPEGARVPLVPVYVHATFRILPKGAWRLHPSPIRLLIGEPISTVDLTLDDRDALRERARAAILALRARVDAPRPGA